MEIKATIEVIVYRYQSTLKQQSFSTRKTLMIKTTKQYKEANVKFYDDKKTVGNIEHSIKIW